MNVYRATGFITSVEISTMKRFITFCAFCFVIAGICEELRSQVFVPAGIISYPNESVDIAKSTCFVSLQIESQFVICTPFARYTPESRVALETSKSHYLWAPLIDLIERRDELEEDSVKFAIDSAMGDLCFFHLNNGMPSNEEARQLWSGIRERAIDLTLASKNISIPKTATIFGYELRYKIESRVNEVVIGSMVESDNNWKEVTNEPLFHFKLNFGNLPSGYGGICFSESISNKDEVANSFVGFCVPNLDAVEDASTESKTEFVMLHPLTILKLYELYKDPRTHLKK